MDQTSHFEHSPESRRSRWELPRRRRGDHDRQAGEGATLVAESSNDQPRSSDDFAD
ncbi:MAG: hypothetical protein ACK5CE_15475 [Actinomycetes bacterium]|nr:hypothetical protein [Actinomycetota bacterium]